MGKSFNTSKNYAVLTAFSGGSPASSVNVGYLYYVADQVVSHAEMLLSQQGTAATSILLSSMWLMEESPGGEYTTLDGRKWSKVYEYEF